MTPEERAREIVVSVFGKDCSEPEYMAKQKLWKDYDVLVNKIAVALSSGPSDTKPDISHKDVTQACVTSPKLDEKELEDAARSHATKDTYTQINSGDIKPTGTIVDIEVCDAFKAGYRMATDKLHRYEQALKTLAQTEPLAREALEGK